MIPAQKACASHPQQACLLTAAKDLTFWGWLAEYDFMAPPREKRAEAVAFISNCGAQSFRLEAVQQLGTAVQVHSYGACEHNSDADGATKEDILPSYRFTLAFENSQV